MNSSFFTFEGKEYIISYKNKKLEIFQKKDNNLISLSNDEYTKMTKLLNSKYGYIYDKDLLTELINSNNEIENKPYVLNFLKWLEKIIPENCRENLYTNIKTLKTSLNLDIKLDESTYIEEKNMTFAGYNTSKNSLNINKESLLILWNIAKNKDNPKEFYWKEYAESLLHELSHMASSKYDVKTKISLCGFDKFPAENEEDKNRGLTEGFTEIISMAGISDTLELSSIYYIEACLINQLTKLIGIDIFEKSYFSNLGIYPLKEKLQELINDQEKSYELFRNIELNFQIKDIYGKQNVLGNIQSSILDYLEQKLKISNNPKEIIDDYKNYLITPELLELLLKNKENYIGIEESINKFEKLQELYKTKKL